MKWVWTLFGYETEAAKAYDSAKTRHFALNYDGLPIGWLSARGEIELARCLPIEHWPIRLRPKIIRAARAGQRLTRAIRTQQQRLAQLASRKEYEREDQ